MKNHPNINSIYISKQLEELLEIIPQYRVTTVIAPTGYGKSVFLSQLEEKLKREYTDAIVLKQEILSDDPTDIWSGFCYTLREHPQLTKHLEKLSFPKNLHEIEMLVEVIADTWSVGETTPIYFIMENIQRIDKEIIVPFIIHLGGRLPENVHIVLSSRYKIFEDAQILALGNKLICVNTDDLKFSREDLDEYTKEVGVDIPSEILDVIFFSSEGWPALAYLMVKDYIQSGSFKYQSVDAVNLMEQVVMSNLGKREKLFLALNALTPEFTADQAMAMWGDDGEAIEILDILTKDNGFISLSIEGTYRYHSMLRRCALDQFENLSAEEKTEAYIKLGGWYQNHKEYAKAEQYYEMSGNYERLLDCVDEDRPYLADMHHFQLTASIAKNCPREILAKHPYAMLCFMLSFFLSKRIPEMKYMSEFILETVREDTTLSEEERNNILGERELVMAFLAYNDTTAMNICQRRALTMLTRTSVIINKDAPWTFGNLSVAGMYHRRSGELQNEVEAMKDGLTAYTQLTDGHGSGADYLMKAECAYLAGNMVDAEVAYHIAYAAAKRKQQDCLILDAELLNIRMAIFKGDYEIVITCIQRIRQMLRDNRNFSLRSTFELGRAWLSSMFGEVDKIPEWIFDEDADKFVSVQVHPQLYCVRNLCYLARKEWTKVLASEVELVPLYEKSNTLLMLIYLYIQIAVAHEKTGNTGKAINALYKAVELAAPDYIIFPFIEVDECVAGLMGANIFTSEYRELTNSVRGLSGRYYFGKEQILKKYKNNDEDYNLTEREWEVARLAAKRYTNKEIAEELNLSDYTVKNHLKNIFDKVGIKGTDKNKRIILQEKLKIR